MPNAARLNGDSPVYQLTVDAADVVTVTDHEDRDEAHGQLIAHVVRGDYYLRTIQTGPAHSTYELLTLAMGRRRPRSTGHAIIEEVGVQDAHPVDAPELAALNAWRWIARHELTWQRGSDPHPAHGYPLAVLSAARAESRGWFSAGLLLPEAARLADAGSIPRPSQRCLEALRHSAIAWPIARVEGLAAAVVADIEIPVVAATLPALIWWYALLSWGARAT